MVVCLHNQLGACMQEAAFDDGLEHSMLAVWVASNPALQGDREFRICKVGANQVFPAFIIKFEAT